MPINGSRLKAFLSWLKEAQHAILLVIIICVALFISLRLYPTEPVIRLTGLFLQLLGIGTVIWGIRETRAIFGHPSVPSKIKAWLSRFPRLRRKFVDGVSNATISSVTSKPRLGLRYDPMNQTVEARLESLEKNITLIYECISETQNEMDEEFQKIVEALNREGQSRQAEDSAIREKLEATGTGGIHISMIGATCLGVGIILSTAAIEIANWLK